MQVSGEFQVGVPRAEVFHLVSNPQRLALCIPGLHDLQELGDNAYAAVLEVEVAFLKPKFDVVVHLTEVQEPVYLKATVTGKPKAIAGKLTAVAELFLSDAENQQTVVKYVLDQSITGKLGGIGQSVFRAKCQEMADVFAANLIQSLEPFKEAFS